MGKPTVKVIVLLVTLSILLTTMGGLVDAAVGTYTVQPGDSLWSIARAFNTTVNYLKQLNNYWSNVIQAGQKLQVPGTAASIGWIYSVKNGDSLWKIASKTGTNVTAIKQANDLGTSTVYTGQKITIPTGSQSDLDLLARVIHAEARGESYQGKVAVGAVLVNRVQSSKFPNTLSGVVYQKNAFETVSNGQIWLTPSAESYKAARAALSGQDPTYGALYFYNPAKIHDPYSWIWTRRITTKIGNHNFAI